MKISQCFNPDCLKAHKEHLNNGQFCQHQGKDLLLVQRYLAIHTLGQGKLGKTFLAVDELKPSLPLCVIKQIFPQAQGTDNVETVSEVWAKKAEHFKKLSQHERIPELMAYFTQGNYRYLVQEYIAGETLAQELENKGVFKENEIWQLLTDVLSVLQFVHHNNVIHGDIKPENLIRRSKDHKIVLVDFSVPILTVPENDNMTGTVMSSAEYTSLEPNMGKSKSCIDLYSLGVTCLHLLTQVFPFDLYSIDQGRWVWRDFLYENSVSKKLGKILDKLVDTTVKRRYQSAEEVLHDISVRM